jgi:Kef-type K+ transport system membrane component KefB
MENLFFELGIIIISATVLVYLARLLKQPFIPAYILTGLLLGPLTGLITRSETISLLSEIGIAFLLFLTGLELDLHRLKEVKLISLLGGSLQVLFLFGIGYWIGLSFGFSSISAVYIALMISFSSTMVVVKHLSDKRELDSLHGRISIGMLLVEDILAIVALTLLTAQASVGLPALALSFFKGIGLTVGAFLCSRYLFPSIFKKAASSQELLFLGSLSVCFIFALLFSFNGFSIAIGAFVAGVALANLPYHLGIISKVTSLKDFFATIFFVSLGTQIILQQVRTMLPLALLLSAVVLFIKPLLRMATCSVFGYKKRPSFLVSMSLTQISEFSLILAAQGIMLGHIDSSILFLVTLVAAFTITISSYYMEYSNWIFAKLNKSIHHFEKLHMVDLPLHQPLSKPNAPSVVVCGYNRTGYSIVDALANSLKQNLLVVDFNPDAIRKLQANKIPCMYGDAGDVEFIDRLNPKRLKMLISTVPSLDVNRLLLQKLRSTNKKAQVILTANQVDEALDLYEHGADYVILPHMLGGHHAAGIIKKMNSGGFKAGKETIIQELLEFKQLGFDKHI